MLSWAKIPRTVPALANATVWTAFLPGCVLLIVIGLAAVLWMRDRTVTDEAQRHAFEDHANTIDSEIASRLSRIEDLLWVIRAEFAQTPDITNAQWRNFVGQIEVERRFPGVGGIGLVSNLHGDELAKFVAARRRDVPNFQVAPSGDRRDYMINSFVSQPSSVAALGFDAGTNPERRAALEEARDTGQATFSHKVTLLNKDDILAYLPIFAPGLPTTTKDERAKAIKGWAAIAFSMPSLMAGVVKPGEPTALEVFDDEPSAQTLVFSVAGLDIAQDPSGRRLESQTTMSIGGRNYSIRVSSLAPPSHVFIGSAIVLAIGCLLLLIVMQKIIAAVQQKEERLRLFLETSNDGYWDWDMVSGAVFFSPHFAEMLGYEADEFRSFQSRWEELVHPDDRPAIRQAFIEHLRGERPRVDHEYRLRDCSGGWLWVRETAAVVRRVGQRAVRMSGMVTDISESRAIEDRLRLLSTAMDQSPASVVITNATGVILYVNQLFTKVTGHSFDAAIGQKPTIIASGLTPKHVYEEMWESITAGKEWRGELCNRKKNGELYWEDACITQVRGYDDTIFYVGVKEDITDKKQAENLLLHSQKMEAIGILAGGIAHDFNNILTSILGFNHLILGDLGDQEAVVSHVQQIHRAAERAKDLVRQILTFSRQVPSQKAAIDLCAIVNEVYQLVRTAAPATIKVSLELPPGKAMVLGTSIQLHQVLMNLCLNAIDAIGGDNGTISVVLQQRDGGYNLSVTDSGCGVLSDIQTRIFDPFFTTKSIGMGTGLGLSVVHGIVVDLGGTISLESPPEGGARFVIGLPECDQPDQTVTIAPSPPPIPTAGAVRRVLVVDDDQAIVDLLRRFFERMGYGVTTCTLSTKAVELICNGERFDLVVTDQMMPDVTGVELAKTIASHAPGTRVLLCSGRDDMVDYDEISASQIDGFLLKPFNLIELADTVECLRREAG
jgi:PAS domain S-box-containing protein